MYAQININNNNNEKMSNIPTKALHQTPYKK